METLMITSEFSSAFSMGQEVEFMPGFKQSNKMGIAQEPMDGQIVAVKFTEEKVFYDLYSPYYGVIFTNVQSHNVKGTAVTNPPLAKAE
jgi:hypothetical protein